MSASGYAQGTIGAADDLLEADGDETLSFHQASARGRDLVEQRRANAKAEKDGSGLNGPVRGRRVRRGARIASARAEWRLAWPTAGEGATHAPRPFGSMADDKLHEITRDKLRAWRKRMADKGLAVAICAARHERFPRGAQRWCGGASFPPASGAASRGQGRPRGSGEAYSPVAREAQVLPDADVRRIISATWEVDAERG